MKCINAIEWAYVLLAVAWVIMWLAPGAIGPAVWALMCFSFMMLLSVVLLIGDVYDYLYMRDKQ